MPRRGRKFVGSLWKDAFLYDAGHGFDPADPDEFASDNLMARAWFRDAPDAASMVMMDRDGVFAVHYTRIAGEKWAAYKLKVPQDEFVELVRQFMHRFPRPFKPNGRQFASLAYEMLINYVAVGPPPRVVTWYTTEELPRPVHLFLDRS